MPDAKLDFLVNPEFAGILDFSPFPVDRKIIFERHKLASWRFFQEYRKLRKALREEFYDVVIDFQGLFRSGWLSFICRCAMRVGFRGARERTAEIFYTRKCSADLNVHAVERYAAMAKEIFDIDEEPFQADLPVSDSAVQGLPELPKKYIVFLPGTRWQSKRFPTDVFADIKKRTAAEHPEYAFVVSGGAAEKGLAAEIGRDVIDLAGETTLPQAVELLRRAAAVVGNDSGPLHAAAALKVPVFGFYGATDPVLTGPWGDNCRFFTAECGCAGCLKRECPDGSYRCWKLDTENIAREIGKIL